MGYIDASGYHKGDVPMQNAVPHPTSVWRGGDHDRQRADHARDLLKPRLADGSWNSEFLQQYPEEAKASWGWEPPVSENLRSK